jgi:3-phenylpropionate/trans-cinnamate dioxygenase ferredoxin component
MTDFVQVAKASEIQPGERKSFWVNSQRVMVLNIDGTFYAVDESCPHRECSMAEGKLTGKVITCPCHYAQFDLETGEVLVQPASNPPTFELPIHQVKLEDDNIMVALCQEADAY